MNLKLFEVAGTHIFNMSAITIVLFFVFAIVVVGYLLGKISVKGVSLGTAAIFLVALFVGHFKGVAFDPESGIQAWVNDVESADAVDFYFKLIQNFGLILFVTSVGLIAGPTFFKNLKKNAKSYVLIGAVIIASGAAVCAVITLLVPNMNSAMSVGLLSGALTSTPAFAAAQEAIGEASPVYSEIAVGHAIAYPFGVIGVVLFVQIVPKVMKANMAEERAKLTPVDSGKVEESALAGKKMFHMDHLGLGVFALAVLCGTAVGCINIPLGAGSFNLGTTGGPLIVGLIFGHFGRIGRFSLKVDKHLLETFQEWGLVLFLIGAGVDGGAGFVSTLEKYGPMLFVWGALMTIIPMFIGFFLAKSALKLSLFNNLGAITGGMTSTPALGALISSSGTPNVATAYAATYPVALVLVVLASQFLTYL